MHRLLKLFLAVPLVAVLLAGCSLLPEKIDETRGWSAQRLYSEAKESMNGGNYKTALEYLDKLQARYPFGRLAQQAQLDTIYIQYKDNEPDAALAAADHAEEVGLEPSVAAEGDAAVGHAAGTAGDPERGRALVASVQSLAACAGARARGATCSIMPVPSACTEINTLSPMVARSVVRRVCFSLPRRWHTTSPSPVRTVKKPLWARMTSPSIMGDL